MSVVDVRREMEKLTSVLLRSRIAVDTNAVVAKRNGGTTLLTWGGSLLGEPFSPAGGFASISEYRRLLRHREYLCLLSDGGVVQLSFSFDRDDLKKHRMVFFPCPVLWRPGTIGEDAEVDVIELFDEHVYQTLDELTEDEIDLSAERASRLRLRSPLRFDYDIDSMAEGHPGSHLHLSDESIRWAVFGPLCVGHFVRFVFRHFYPALWKGVAEIRDWPLANGNRCVTPPEELELFVECRPTRR